MASDGASIYNKGNVTQYDVIAIISGRWISLAIGNWQKKMKKTQEEWTFLLYLFCLLLLLLFAFGLMYFESAKGSCYNVNCMQFFVVYYFHIPNVILIELVFLEYYTFWILVALKSIFIQMHYEIIYIWPKANNKNNKNQNNISPTAKM